ncbi:hypothetical protein EON67_10070 [archaeon]|nr:MAG: hypothetical protein EON67_10070 [archaeon]
MSSIFNDYYFHLSADVDVDLKVYIDYAQLGGSTHRAAGALPRSTAVAAPAALAASTAATPPALHEAADDFVVSVRLMDGGLPLVSGYKATNVPYRQGECVHWGEWITLPIKIRDTPKTAQLVRCAVCYPRATCLCAALRAVYLCVCACVCALRRRTARRATRRCVCSAPRLR